MLRWERVNDDEDDSIKGEYRDIHISDIKGDLMKMSLGELKCLKEKCLARERSSDVDYIAGVPSTYLAFFFHSEYRMMFERHCLYQLIYENELNIDSEEKVMAAFFEVLSKALVYREPKITRKRKARQNSFNPMFKSAVLSPVRYADIHQYGPRV